MQSVYGSKIGVSGCGPEFGFKKVGFVVMDSRI